MRRGMQSIKFEKVIVVWQDINSCTTAWNTEQDLKDLQPAMCTTIGYLYEDNDNYIKTFATYSIDPITNEMDVGDAVVIPKGVIIKLQKLES
jgi:hypothetical protein